MGLFTCRIRRDFINLQNTLLAITYTLSTMPPRRVIPACPVSPRITLHLGTMDAPQLHHLTSPLAPVTSPCCSAPFLTCMTLDSTRKHPQQSNPFLRRLQHRPQDPFCHPYAPARPALAFRRTSIVPRSSLSMVGRRQLLEGLQGRYGREEFRTGSSRGGQVDGRTWMSHQSRRRVI